MLANERLICKMSIEQKIKLITSLNMYGSSADENYEFPVFRLLQNPLQDCNGAFVTQFPSDRALASSWNKLLIGEVYSKHGQETGAVKKYAYFNVTDDKTFENVSEDYYLTAEFLRNKINGLRSAKQYVNFEETAPLSADAELLRNLRDTVLRGSRPDSVLVKSPESAEEYSGRYKCGGLYYGFASDCADAARHLFNGCSLLFLKEDFTEKLVTYITALTVNYKAAYSDYRAEIITMGELDRRCRALEILDENNLDEACDRLISLLLEMRSRGADSLPDANGLNFNHTPLFNEPAHDALSVSAARQSVVLMKNDGILPVSNMLKIAVIGEYGKDYSYQTEYFSGKATAERVPFGSVNLYDINGVGFASGYTKGMTGRTDLTDAAISLCSDADCAIVYLCAEKGQRYLPVEQTELIDKLYSKGVKIIAVVASDGAIDMGFAQKCCAVLFSFRGGQGVTRAVIDIIKGEASPSGRLTETLPVSYEGRTEPCDYRTMNRSEVRYPFGFGLSYTQFEYSNLKISEKGLSCTVKNTGGSDGFAVVQFYLQKTKCSTALKDKLLRGFSKVYVKKHDSVRVEIPFDVNTFKSYDPDSGLYRIEGGEYRVFVSENYFNDKLTGTVTLTEFVFKDSFSNEVAQTASGEDVGKIKFDETQEPPEVKKAKKQLSFGVKLFVALLLFVYYNGVLAALTFTEVIADKNLIFYIVIGVLAAVFNALFIAYVVVISKRRKRQHYVKVNDVLTDMVERVAEFDQIAKVTYKSPVEEELPEDEEESDPSAIEQSEAAKTYDLSFAEAEEDAEVAEQVTLDEMCANFKAYAQSKGVAVDAASVRAVLAAVGSGKIILLTSKNTEVLPEFAEALNGYFGNTEYTAANGNYSSVFDILWNGADGKFVVSGFANQVYSASKTPDKACAALICGADVTNIAEWFKPFIDYANRPTEEHILKLNEEFSFRLPDNLTYFIISDGANVKTAAREVADASLNIEVVISKFNGEMTQTEAKTPSVNALAEGVKAARENSFLPEKIWKKIDELFETVNSNERFVFGNKNTLQLEKFTSVILDCGGDEAECLTALFLFKIAPVLKQTRMYKSEGGDKTVFGIIEKLFAEDDLTKIQKALTKAV